MTCAVTKTLNGKSWPLFRQSDASLCCYKVETTTKREMADVVADAETKSDYAKRTRMWKVGNKYRIYIYFNE